jgi:hypothetical protein
MALTAKNRTFTATSTAEKVHPSPWANDMSIEAVATGPVLTDGQSAATAASSPGLGPLARRFRYHRRAPQIDHGSLASLVRPLSGGGGGVAGFVEPPTPITVAATTPAPSEG